MNITDIKSILKSNNSLLLEMLEYYGSTKKNKSTKGRSCVFCNSSDALHIKQNDNTYKCFSCSETGDIINLVEKKESLDFIKALKFLCDKTNIEFKTNKNEYTEEEKKRFFAIKQSKKELEQFIKEYENYLEFQYKAKINEKKLNEAFEISCAIDRIKELKRTERINYAKYKAHETYKIDKYLGEKAEGYINAINRAQKGSKELIVAPTGSGKTCGTINELKKNNIKSIFVVPNASQVQQIIEEYEIAGAHGYEINALEVAQNNNVTVMTWDKLEQLKSFDLSEHILIIDEIHQTFNDMYRAKAIKSVVEISKKSKGIIDITATPSKIIFEKYDKITEYKQKKQTKYNVKLYDNVDLEKVISIINNSKKSAVLLDDKKELNYIQNKINKSSDIVESNTKDSNITYMNIIKNSKMDNTQVLLNTSCIIAGVNIKEPFMTDIIVVGFKDIGTIKQYVARFRELKEVNVHVFNNYKNIESSIFEIEYKASKIIETTETLVDNLNKALSIANETFRQIDNNFRPLKLQESDNRFYYSELYEKYVVNIEGIKHECYRSYYNNATIISFKSLLHEYFNNIEIINNQKFDNIELKIFKKEMKIQKEEALNVLASEKELIVGINDIIKNKTNPNLDKYFRENNLDVENIKLQLLEKNLYTLNQITGVNSITKLYTKYITENSFNYDLAWKLANMSNRSRGMFFQQLNLITFKQLQEQAPQAINNNYLENRLYNIMNHELQIGMSYTKEHLEILQEAIKISTGYEISINELGTKINSIYIVESNQVTLSNNMCNRLDYIYYKNINPNPLQNKKKRIKINTIKDYISIDYLCKKNELSEESSRVLSLVVNKKVESIKDDFNLKNPFL